MRLVWHVGRRIEMLDVDGGCVRTVNMRARGMFSYPDGDRNVLARTEVLTDIRLVIVITVYFKERRNNHTFWFLRLRLRLA